jgi:hypothetical protein
VKSPIIFFFRDEKLGWIDARMDGWKGQPPNPYAFTVFGIMQETPKEK